MKLEGKREITENKMSSVGQPTRRWRIILKYFLRKKSSDVVG